jgi:hypothetical protein
MFTRCIALLLIPVLPFVPLMANFGGATTANAVIAGALAMALAFASLIDDRARVGVALIGAWVAFSPFVFRSSMLEDIVAVCWGVSTFVLMAGPFSDRPRVIVAPATRAETQRDTDRDQPLPLAA